MPLDRHNQEYRVIGNIGRDAQPRVAERNGEKFHFLSYSVATNRKVGPPDNQTDQVTWVSCIQNYDPENEKQLSYFQDVLKKKAQIWVEGYLIVDSSGNPTTYTAGDGTIRGQLQMRVTGFRVLQRADQVEARQSEAPAIEDDDIFF